ncbi:MAG: hypothetical protein ABI946_04840 [Chthoniobacterales bacterium]
MSNPRVIAALAIALAATVVFVVWVRMPGFGLSRTPPRSVISPEAPSPPNEESAAESASPSPEGNALAPVPKPPVGSVRITTSPMGANYAIFPGVLDKLPPPATPPLRVGVTPVELRDLPPAEYTIFFQYLDWPVELTGITLTAGEVFPVDFIFPYGCAEITSDPDGAQIFHGDRWLGKTPLTVALPLGPQQLIARVSDRPEKKQTVTIEQLSDTEVAFEIPTESTRSPRRKSTPPPSVLERLGRTMKKVFTPKPAPRRKKN